MQNIKRRYRDTWKERLQVQSSRRSGQISKSGKRSTTTTTTRSRATQIGKQLKLAIKISTIATKIYLYFSTTKKKAIDIELFVHQLQESIVAIVVKAKLVK